MRKNIVNTKNINSKANTQSDPLLQNRNDIIIHFSTDYKITGFNQVAEEIYKCNSKDVIGKNVLKLSTVNEWHLPFLTDIKNTDNNLLNYDWSILRQYDNNKLSGFILIGSKHSAQKDKIQIYLNNILARLPGSIYWKDDQGIYLGCNNFVAEMAGFSSSLDIIDKTDYDLPWRDIADQLAETDKRIMRTGVSEELIEMPTLSDGRQIIMLTHKAPLYDNENNIIGIIGISVDITELKNTQNALKEQIKKTEQANRSSGKFIAQAAHEIRNPISSVISFIDEIKEHYENLYQNFIKIVKPMLAKASLEDLAKEIDDSYNELKTCQEYAAGAAQGTDKALRNLEKLHFLQLIGVKTNWELNRIADLVKEAIKECNRANAKQVEIKVEYSNELPEEIVLDFNNLRDALAIVIGNAIRFSLPKEIVKVCVKKVKIDASNYIDFIIQDFGVGIAQEQLNELFNANNQEDISVVEIFKKPSVQLKRVKLIVEASGGNLIINSGSKKGTIVTIRIPYKAASENIESKDTNETITNKNDKTDECRILIVEDDKFIQMNHLRYLTALEYKYVDIASNGFEAVNMALENDYDIVLLDLTLPEINGIEVMKKIIANKGDKAIFIVITSHTSEDTESYCLSQGAMAVLTKPVSKNDLKQYIEAALEIRRQIDSED